MGLAERYGYSCRAWFAVFTVMAFVSMQLEVRSWQAGTLSSLIEPVQRWLFVNIEKFLAYLYQLIRLVSGILCPSSHESVLYLYHCLLPPKGRLLHPDPFHSQQTCLTRKKKATHRLWGSHN